MHSHERSHAHKPTEHVPGVPPGASALLTWGEMEASCFDWSKGLTAVVQARPPMEAYTTAFPHHPTRPTQASAAMPLPQRTCGGRTYGMGESKHDS
jgi:hypothetical protein